MKPTQRALAAALLLASCATGGRPPLDRVPAGTWGGEDAGLIVTADGAHAHVGCTVGDVAGPIPLDGEGRFDVAGTYDVDAFPIDRGILHPARFTGRTDGQTFDSGELVVGREPRMRVCPICRR